jgi:hypothetical protein
MLYNMRHLEVHVIQTEQDVDLAMQAGLVTADQLNYTLCAECAEDIGHTTLGFESFAVVIDETDRDWAVCLECASPLIDSFETYRTEFPATFDEDDLEKF